MGIVIKKILLIVFICFTLFAYCEAPHPTKQKQKNEVKQNAKEISYEKIALAELKEKELLKLLKVWPAIKDDIIKLHIEIEDDFFEQHFKGPEEILRAFLEPYAHINQRIPGLEARLQAEGMPWDEFWPAFSKTLTIHFLMGISSNFHLSKDTMERKENEQKLKEPQVSENEKEEIRLNLYLTDLSLKVPKANGVIFFKYQEQTETMLDNY